MKRTLLLTVFGLFLCAASAWAQSSLKIHKKDGGTVTYSFSQKPVITYTSDGLHLATKSISVDYPLSKIEKFTFEDSGSDIETIRTEGAEADIQIFTIDGTLVHTIQSTEGTTSFCLENLPTGTYVIKNSNTTYKIIKR